MKFKMIYCQKNRPVILVLLLFCLIDPAFPQTSSEEEFLENQTETSEQTELLETLERLRRQPIRINSASENELLALPFLLPTDARAIVNYRESKGSFSGPADLDSIPNLNREVIELIVPYLKFEESNRAFKIPMHLALRTKVVRKQNDVENGENEGYFDSPNSFYQRLTLSAGEKFDSGFLIEKDSGEKNYNDFQAGYLRIHSLPFESSVTLGNYSLSNSLGLIFGGIYGSGFSVNPLRSGDGISRRIKPYRSTGENQALNGLAWSFNSTRLAGVVFYSNSRRDVSLDPAGQILSFYSAGLHRTEKELAKKDLVKERVNGFSISFTPVNFFQIGCTWVQTKFNNPVVVSDLLRQRFDFQGTTNELVGLDWNIFWNKLSFIGEVARSQAGKTASTFGIILSERNLTASFLLRHYDRQFHSFYGRAFGGFSASPQNEDGFFANLSYRLSPETRISGYFDFSRNRWRSYFEPMPIEKQRSLIQIVHKINPAWQFTLQWRSLDAQEHQIRTDEWGHERLPQISQLNNNVRVQIDFRLSEQFLLRNRIEKKWTKMLQNALWHENENERESGWVAYQDFVFRLFSSLTVQARFCYFDVSSYSARLYAYENDVPGVMNNRMFMGRGNRHYLLLKYSLSNHLDLAFKWASDYNDILPGNNNTGSQFSRKTVNDFALVADIQI